MQTTPSLQTGLTSLGLIGIVSLAAWLASASAPALPLSGGPIPLDSVNYIVTAPGSYCLTVNLIVGPLNTGIEVLADDVSIDLGGHYIRGVGGANMSIGIDAANAKHVEVFNGTIQRLGLKGAYLSDFAVCRDLNIQDCFGGGLETGAFARVEHCTFRQNQPYDVTAREFSTVQDCTIFTESSSSGIILGKASVCERVNVRSGEVAFSLGDNSRITECTAVEFSDTGISAGKGSLVESCTVEGWTLKAATGIAVGSVSRVRDCVVNGNVNVGIQAANECDVQDCSVSNAVIIGFIVGDVSRLRGCLASYCNPSLGPGSGGATVGHDTEVSSCTFTNNGGNGLRFNGFGGVVRDCFSSGNSLDGIRVLDGALVQDNSTPKNGRNGITIVKDRAVLRDNVADFNVRGIQVMGLGTLLTGNRAASNTHSDYDVRYGNPTGPINQHSGTIGGSVPQANFKTPF